jgi:hypothetical protein
MYVNRLLVELLIALSATWFSMAGAKANFTYTYTANQG